MNVKCEHDLFAINVKGENGVLRDVLYQDLNRCWQVYEGAGRTRALHPEWTKTKICLDMLSNIGTSTLHGACGGSSSCRMGCQEAETLTHIIMDCTHYKDCRLKLVRECDRLKLVINVNNAMCHPDLHLLTENFFVLLNDKK